MDKAEYHLKKISLKNKIKYKKQIFAKLINIPEAIDEALALKSEINRLEDELEDLQ